MKYLSVCSGIEAASVAWHGMGWEPVAFSEIEPFPSAVLAERFPGVPNLGDMTRFKEWKIERPDVLVGGTPCQAFSVAGLRGGLEDPRGNLMLTYGDIAAHFRPTVFVWENVPGVFSSAGGRDFASFLGLLTGRKVGVPEGGWANSGIIGGISSAYGVAWRVLDAQYFGVAQRRRRVFVVGYLGDWRRAAQVLFESESLFGDSPPSRETGKGSSRGATFGIDEECNATEDGFGPLLRGGQGGTRQAVAYGVKVHDGRGVGEGDLVPLLARSLTARADGSPCADRGPDMIPVGFNARQDPDSWDDRTGPLDTDGGTQAVQNHGVRRLTPRECERLQGFPDDWTLIPWRGKMAPDGPRYKACGNSMAVPVMRWIGQRIEALK